MSSSSSSPAVVHRFYSTDVSPCPYLPGRQERRLVALAGGPEEGDQRLDLLTEAGFRRSQGFLYKPVCPGCAGCVPVRVPVDRFRPSRTFRKVLKRNADLAFAERPARATPEQFALFRRYLASRHGDGGMVKMGWESYRDMVEVSPPSTRVVEFRDARRPPRGRQPHRLHPLRPLRRLQVLRARGEQRSLGTFAILWHLSRARELGLPYVYLGYWIEDCRKMAYKSRFAPLERLDGAEWVPLELGAAEEA
jgi:arginine-tRNA-protein transferase